MKTALSKVWRNITVSKVKNLPTIIKCLVTAKEYTDPSEWSIVPRRPNEPVASHMWTTLWEPLKSFSYKIRQDLDRNDVGLTDETSKAQLWFLFSSKTIHNRIENRWKERKAQQTTKLTYCCGYIVSGYDSQMTYSICVQTYAREEETSTFSSWKQILLP